jgi:hypothetical protein
MGTKQDMDTKQKLEEIWNILDALLGSPRCSKRLLRARDLIESALSDFFSDEDDVVALGNWLDDEPPFPAA